MAVDLSTKTIHNIFLEQIKNLTLQKKIESFDTQFSDIWVR